MSDEAAMTEFSPGPTFIEAVTEPGAFADLVARLAHLSRYVDQAAFAVLEGRSDPRTLQSFLTASVKTFETLTTGLMNLLICPSEKEDAETVFSALECVADLMTAALIIDQAHSWAVNLMNSDAMKLQITMAAAQVAEELANSAAPGVTGHGTYV